MKIRMLSTMAGPNVSRSEGHDYDVPDGEAEELIAGGYAQRLAGAPAEPAEAWTEDAPEAEDEPLTAETATIVPDEDATATPQRKNPPRQPSRSTKEGAS